MSESKSEEPESVKARQLPLPLAHEAKDRIEANIRRASQLKEEREKEKAASAG